MATKLAHYLNGTISVSIPSLFGDDQPRPYKLIVLEEQGLWLQGKDLTERLNSEQALHSGAGTSAAVGG
jgi:hypothetical protein